MSTSNHTTTFWNFLENYSIEIPIIQRDYAQGREKKESLRKNFLTDLKEALDKSKEMKLDFVYGSTENGKLYPLDGQQRLTTLWLLHWYIALRAGKLKEAAAHLMKFSYETRVSSREFCKALCNPDNFGNYHYDKDVIDFITNQTWFYSAWKQDPTIQSMLRMLGGSKNNISKDDGIEVLFGCDNQNCVLCSVLYNECIFDYYFDLLIGQDCPIVFYYLPKDFGNSDDLYIKMNARGEQLTAFENLKAAIDKILPKIDKLESFKVLNDANLKEKNTFDEQWKYCIDRQWTNMFWKYKENYLSDPPFLRFIVNMLSAYWISLNKIKPDDDGEKDKLLRFFLGITGNEDYISFDKFKEVLPSKKENEENESDNKKKLETLVFMADNLNSFHKILELDNLFEICRPSWEKDEYDLIKNVLQLKGDKYNPSNKERAMFYALVKCPYISIIEADKEKAIEKIKRWMRVFWNVVEQEQERIRNFIGAVHLIDELSSKIVDNNCIDIYDWLAEDENEIKSGFMKDQVKEERCKAKQILKNQDVWEQIIKNAEEAKYLKGKIAALFKVDGSGKFLLYDNEKEFNDRYRLFETISSEDNEDKYHFIKILLSYCAQEKPWARLDLRDFKTCLNDSILINCFRQITEDYIKCAVDTPQWIKQLVNTQVLNNSRGKFLKEDKPYLFATEGRNWKAYENVILDDMHCDNPVLSNLVKDGSIQTNHKVNGCNSFSGWDINFKYEKYFFQWNGENKFYLMEDDWKARKKRSTDNTFYCFKIDSMKNSEEFISNLNCIIHQAEADEQNTPCKDDCPNKINGCLYENTEH